MAQDAQRAKLTLTAIPNGFTDRNDDYYVTVKLQKSLTVDDLAREVASRHGHQNAAEVAMLTREMLELADWYLSNGYSVVTPQGAFHPTVRGILLDSELSSAPDRTKLSLNIGYAMSDAMRKLFDEAELDVEIQKSATGPQLFTVVNAQNLSNGTDATTRMDIPIEAGQTCIIRGRGVKVGGTGDEIGITLRRTDTTGGSSIFFPPAKLYPNLPSQVGFVMPADAPEGSTWEVTLCTQLATNSSTLLKKARTVTMADTFTVGQTSSTGGDSGSGGGSGDSGNPLG